MINFPIITGFSKSSQLSHCLNYRIKPALTSHPVFIYLPAFLLAGLQFHLENLFILVLFFGKTNPSCFKKYWLLCFQTIVEIIFARFPLFYNQFTNQLLLKPVIAPNTTISHSNCSPWSSFGFGDSFRFEWCSDSSDFH